MPASLRGHRRTRLDLYSIYDGVDLRGTVGEVGPGKVSDEDRRRTSLLLDSDVKGEIRHIKVARNGLADHGFSLIELPHM
jgi:hypothetical protein